MTAEKARRRVLIVSGTDKTYNYLSELLPPSEFSPILWAGSAGEARRMLLSSSVDIVIINTPLPDDFGTELAVDLAENAMGILLLVKADVYDQIVFQVENSGVLTLPKPNNRQIIYTSVKLLSALSARLQRMEKKNQSLKEKMADIRTVNHAKWLLIENLHMNEKSAHYYIEKQAMDTRASRREVAESIIRTYGA